VMDDNRVTLTRPTGSDAEKIRRKWM
jgi:hypothetical protein